MFFGLDKGFDAAVELGGDGIESGRVAARAIMRASMW